MSAPGFGFQSSGYLMLNNFILGLPSRHDPSLNSRISELNPLTLYSPLPIPIQLLGMSIDHVLAPKVGSSIETKTYFGFPWGDSRSSITMSMWGTDRSSRRVEI